MSTVQLSGIKGLCRKVTAACDHVVHVIKVMSPACLARYTKAVCPEQGLNPATYSVFGIHKGRYRVIPGLMSLCHLMKETFHTTQLRRYFLVGKYLKKTKFTEINLPH